MKNKKVNVILDCDTKNEIDDQFAISYALKSSEINLLGVCSVQNTKKHGSKSIDIYHNEAKKILKLGNSKISAYKGSRFPIKSSKNPEESSAVNFIIKTALNSSEKVYIIGIGPCTNIVNACLLEPKIKKKCVFVWLGGFLDNKEARKQDWKECNFDGDKTGVKILFDLDIDLILIPAWGVTDRMIIQNEYFSQELKIKNTPLSNYLSKLVNETRQKFHIFWDVAAIAVVENLKKSRIKKVPTCKVKDNKIVFLNKNKNKIKLVYSIEEFDILNELKRRLL